MSLFSRRNAPARDTYRYEIPEQVRNRLLHTIRLCLEEKNSGNLSIRDVFAEMHDKILQRYGGFRGSSYEAARISDDPVVEHFFRCRDEELMDFLQMCFETRWNCGGQDTVTAINRVLDEENIGYELTPYSETYSQGGTLFGRFRPSIQTVHAILPKVLRKDEKVLHAETVKPCLDALADTRFATANGELLNAFEEYRQGKYGDAITDAGAAFESVLKIICSIKGWKYDKEKDTCSKLLEICREEGLFHPFYKPILEGTATIRNKVGDAHGKGPKPEYPATKILADHMLYNVCNNINLVIALAKQ
jgi:hypothetical protein